MSNRKPAKPVHGTARLLLDINGIQYALTLLSPDREVARKAWRLRKVESTRKEQYHVLYDCHDGVWGLECDCPDFIFRRNHKDERGCKHLLALQAVGLLPGGSQK